MKGKGKRGKKKRRKEYRQSGKLRKEPQQAKQRHTKEFLKT